MIGVYILIGVIVIVILWVVGTYNGLVRLRNPDRRAAQTQA